MHEAILDPSSVGKRTPQGFNPRPHIWSSRRSSRRSSRSTLSRQALIRTCSPTQANRKIVDAQQAGDRIERHRNYYASLPTWEKIHERPLSLPTSYICKKEALSLKPHQEAYADEEDARRVFESGEEFTLDGRRLGLEYAQGRRKSPHQMRGTGGRGGDRRRSRSPDRHYRPSSRRYSRSRSRSRDRRDRRRDSRSPVRRRSRSRSPSRRRSPSPRSYRRSPSPRRDRRSPSPRSPRRRSPSPEGRRRTPSRGDSPERSSSRRPHSASPERANNDSQHTNGAPEDGSWGEYAPDHNGAPGFEPMA
ncbi:hypothetical protein BGZ52_006261 [Haplosporangium bisporale]|nr:hypothetical protein BGZ52_006261 [Haplosporangium bisporale]KAF9217015.1 hypothetical protein BGZ59_006868 [Podila verticillata]